MDWHLLIVIAGAFLMVVGELLAAFNLRNVLRALLLGSAAELGYALMGAGLRSGPGVTGAILHLEYQLVMRGLVFVALAILARRAGSFRLEQLAGVWQCEPVSALLFGFGLFSVLGLSPFKGSLSKFLVLYAAVEQGHWLLALAGTIASIIGACYNVYLIQRICFERKAELGVTARRSGFSVSLAVAWILAGLTILISLFPQPMLAQAAEWASRFPGAVPEYETPWSLLVLLPYLGGFVIFALGYVHWTLRDAAAITLAAATLVAVWRDAALDRLSWLEAVVFAVICFAVVVYSVPYMRGKQHTNRYYFFLFLLLGSLIGVATEQQFGNFYLFWELMTWTSYLLVIHDQSREALRAGMKYFLICTSAAYIMHLGILLLHAHLHTFDMAKIAASSGQLTSGVLAAILVPFMVGFAAKAGLFPLHSWLPDAHPVAPSSISAPMSGILTKAGVFGLLKVFFVIFSVATVAHGAFAGWSNPLGCLLSIIGGLTLLLGELMALRQTQLKRMLAYSTLAQVGEITAVLGLGTYLSISGSIFHVLNHAVMKSLLFLAAGSMIFRLNGHTLSEMKGVGRVMPLTAICFSIGALSVAGLPPFGGFFSKFLMVYACIEAGNIALAILLLLGGVIAAFYYTRVIRILFFERYQGPPVKEAPLGMQIPVVGLSVLVVLGGIFPDYAVSLVKPIAQMAALRGGLAVAQIPSLQLFWPAPVLITITGAILALAVGKRSPRGAGIVTTISMVLASMALLISPGRYEPLSFWFAVLIALIGAINLLYSIGYLRRAHAHGRYYFLFASMIAGLLGVATSPNLLSFFAFWEVMSSWTLYFLIVHEETIDASREGTKYFVFNVVGASLLFFGVAILCARSGSTSFTAAVQQLKLMPDIWFVLAMCAIVAGLLMKAAMLPLRIDIQMHPSTAPTPVSGYISAVLLKSALFGVLKFMALLGGSLLVYRLGRIASIDTLQYVAAVIAALTMLYAGAMAVIQSGVKRLLIYSTVSQLGYMLLGISLGSALGVAGGLMHLVNHMLLKDTLFLCAGAILSQGHVHSLDELGGLAKRMPITCVVFLGSGLSLSGVPPLNGFSSKWLIYQAALSSGHIWLATAALISSLFTLAAILKFAHAAFMGPATPATEHMTDPPPSMLVSMLLLSSASFAVSVFPGILLVPVAHVQRALGLPSIDATWTGALPGPGSWNSATFFVLLAVLALAGWTYSRLVNRKVVRTHLYLCGTSDIDPVAMRMTASNLYESPDQLLRHGVIPSSEESVEHA